MKKFKCCICGEYYSGYGNNPYPLCNEDDYDSCCCDNCNNLVIKARLDILTTHRSSEQVRNEYLAKYKK